MVRFYHLLNIAAHFSLDLPRVEGSLFLPKLPALHLREPAATTTPEETHATNHCDGGSRFHQTLGLVKRLVREREVMLEVPETELYSLLDQIDILRDEVTGMLPSGSSTSISTDEPDNEPQSNSSGGPSQQSQIPSSTILGGAFIETSVTLSQESPGGSGSTVSAQDSTEQTDEELQEPPEETNAPNPTENLTEQTGEELQEPPEETNKSSSTSKLPNQTGAENQVPPEETKASSFTGELIEHTGAEHQVPPGETTAFSSINELIEHTAAEHQEPPEETYASSFIEEPTEHAGEEDEQLPDATNTFSPYGSLTEQTEDPISKTAQCVGVRQVSGLNPLRRDFNCATGTSAAINAQGQSPSMSTPLNLVDDLDQDLQTSATNFGVEESPQITTPVSLTVPTDLVQASSMALGESAVSKKTREFRTTVLTSTNTAKSTVTRTTTHTKFFYVPLASVHTRLGAGLARNATATPTPNSEDTSETPAIRLPVMKVPDTDTSADETRLSGFKTLSRPTNSVGEGTV
ncbi:hypothetical protein EDB81DRAFT_469557 [Dactylonectria macrodidyma]|uniref:Uncharacterized protein n=1 Tax=Dactylonectria macrodidyma TaxID=307937 RepID=A0A9P9J7S8_9HYPO|nr:hypothetical protein EDB81DRAFT_469557 [Dactylonectria macrodidyma]